MADEANTSRLADAGGVDAGAGPQAARSRLVTAAARTFTPALPLQRATTGIFGRGGACLEWDVAEHLWAPWRLSYIKGEKEEGCIFCNRLHRSDDENDLILYRGQRSFIILNAFPYTNGHLMIVPNVHTWELEAVEDETLGEMDQLLKRSIRALASAFGPNGYNIGWNIGRCAGAGVEDHVHEHVVPRWNGDTNFMPVLAETMVMPELLADTYRTLKAVF